MGQFYGRRQKFGKNRVDDMSRLKSGEKPGDGKNPRWRSGTRVGLFFESGISAKVMFLIMSKQKSKKIKLKVFTTQLPALTPDQCARLADLGFDPSTVPRELHFYLPDDGFDYSPLPLPPQCTSARGATEDYQSRLDAWCAAGGWEDEEFQAFFGL